MVGAAKVITEFFMIVLCLASAPAGQQEVRIDIVDGQGYQATFIARQNKGNYKVYVKKDGDRRMFLTLQMKNPPEHTYTCTGQTGKSETVALAKRIRDLNSGDLKSKKGLHLTTVNGKSIYLKRSKEVSFITTSNNNRTYVVH